jgi:hypothetical protein
MIAKKIERGGGGPATPLPLLREYEVISASSSIGSLAGCAGRGVSNV